MIYDETNFITVVFIGGARGVEDFSDLTIGKCYGVYITYYSVGDGGSHPYSYFIKNDKNRTVNYHISGFITPEEYRDKILKRVIND